MYITLIVTTICSFAADECFHSCSVVVVSTDAASGSPSASLLGRLLFWNGPHCALSSSLFSFLVQFGADAITQSEEGDEVKCALFTSMMFIHKNTKEKRNQRRR